MIVSIGVCVLPLVSGVCLLVRTRSRGVNGSFEIVVECVCAFLFESESFYLCVRVRACMHVPVRACVRVCV